MDILAVARILGAALLAGFAAIVVYQLLAGRINTSGLLDVKGGTDAGTVSVARLQLLATTLVTSTSYLKDVIATGSIPDVAPQWIAIVGVSHAAYLLSKARTLLRSWKRSGE